VGAVGGLILSLPRRVHVRERRKKETKESRRSNAIQNGSKKLTHFLAPRTQ